MGVMPVAEPSFHAIEWAEDCLRLLDQRVRLKSHAYNSAMWNIGTYEGMRDGEIQLRTDNAYRVPNFQTQIDVCRTNKVPSTAMRGHVTSSMRPLERLSERKQK